ncbi:MAG: M23 family metallopeptidase [Candidatus Aquicultor sp.]
MIRRTIAVPIVVLLCFVSLIATAGAADKFTWPIGGEVIKPFDLDEHRGIDIAGATGDSIIAAQEGVVYWIGKTPRGEPCISIDHPGGITTTYLPVTASVSKGQIVKAGDTIGKLSSEIDKSSSVQHLHLGLFETTTRDNKKYLDPCNYLSDVSGATEDKHEPAIAVDISSGSTIEKLPESQQHSIVDEEAYPAATQQTQQQVAMSPVDVTEKPIENAKPEALPSLSMSNVKAGEAALADAAIQSQMHPEQKAESFDIQVNRSPQNSISVTNKISQDAAAKVGLPNLSWVAPEVKPDLVPAVNHAPAAVKMVSPEKTRELYVAGGERIEPSSSTSNNRAQTKINSMVAYAGQPATNPFKQADSVKQLVDHTKREVLADKRATKQNPTMAQRVFKWQFLPEITSALAILLIAMISYQCARSAKAIGASLTGVASATC